MLPFIVKFVKEDTIGCTTVNSGKDKIGIFYAMDMVDH